jgi:hypothetical protein
MVALQHFCIFGGDFSVHYVCKMVSIHYIGGLRLVRKERLLNVMNKIRISHRQKIRRIRKKIRPKGRTSI